MSVIKRLFVYSSLLIFIIVILVSINTNKEIDNILTSKDTSFKYQENELNVVKTELVTLFTCSSAEEFNIAKLNSKMTKDLSQSLYGTRFNRSNFLNADSIKFIEVRFTPDNEEGIYKYYIKCSMFIDGEPKKLTVIVKTFNNKIYDLIYI